MATIEAARENDGKKEIVIRVRFSSNLDGNAKMIRFEGEFSLDRICARLLGAGDCRLNQWILAILLEIGEEINEKMASAR